MAPTQPRALPVGASARFAGGLMLIFAATSATAQAVDCRPDEHGYPGRPFTITLTYDNPLAPVPAPDPFAPGDDFFANAGPSPNGGRQA